MSITLVTIKHFEKIFDDLPFHFLVNIFQYFTLDKQMKKLLYAEANAFAGLRHRNIVGFLGIKNTNQTLICPSNYLYFCLPGVCSSAPNYALVMEYVNDGVLRSHLNETLEPRKLIEWAKQLAKVTV